MDWRMCGQIWSDNGLGLCQQQFVADIIVLMSCNLIAYRLSAESKNWIRAVHEDVDQD